MSLNSTVVNYYNLYFVWAYMLSQGQGFEVIVDEKGKAASFPLV